MLRKGYPRILLPALLAVACATGQETGEPVPDAPSPEAIAERAYRYGLQQVVYYVTRYAYTQKEDSGVFSGVNRWRFADVGSSIETLDGTAFLDLQQEPVILYTPETSGRYQTLRLMDPYGISFLYAGTPFDGDGERRYLILPRDYDGPIPPDFATTELIRAPARSVLATYRIALQDPADATERAQEDELRSQATITPLGAWIANGRAPLMRDEQPLVRGDYRTISRMAALTEEQVGRQTAEDFFTLLGLVLADPSLPTMEDSAKEREMLEQLASVGLVAGEPFDWSDLSAGLRESLDAGFKTGFRQVRRRRLERRVDLNGWTMMRNPGGFETDWLSRAVMADVGWGRPDRNLLEADASLSKDAGGNALNGKHRYTLSFKAVAQPPVTQFWSIAIPDSNGSVNSFMLDSGRLAIRDGRLTIYIQHERPADPGQIRNWLPAPEGEFRVEARLFGPLWAVFDGSYRIPPAERVILSPPRVGRSGAR